MKSISISLGIINLGEYQLCSSEIKLLNNKFESVGLEIIHDNKSKLIERIKTSIMESVSENDEFKKLNISVYLNRKLDHDYAYLSNLFSSVKE